jgi:uncharacterized protein YneF (UPF0154 family)
VTEMKIVLGSLVLLGVGHISGQFYQSWYIKKRMTKAVPLLENSLSDIIVKVVDGDLKGEEIKDLMATDFEFMKIVLGEK